MTFQLCTRTCVFRGLAVLALVATTCLFLAPDVQAKGGNKRLASGKIKIDGVPVVDQNGLLVATKRTTILWRYMDTDGDGEFTWGGLPLIGDDFRIVCRSIYTFTSDFTPDPNWSGQLSTYHWGPRDPVTGNLIPSVFRGVRYDDFIVGMPVPGDFLATIGCDGPIILGINLTAQLFTEAGDWDPALGPTNPAHLHWGIKYLLTFDPGTPHVIPAGAVLFFDSQLDMQNLGVINCENGWSEEDYITTGGAMGFVQEGPNTADPLSYLLYPKLEAPPLLFVPGGVPGTPSHPCFTP